MVELNGESGQITSPGYPEKYDISLNCRYSLTVEPNNRIKIEIEDLSTEPGYDWLELFDGNTSNAPSLGRFSGGRKFHSINTSRNQLFIKFISSGYNTASRGFKLNYSTLTGEGIILYIRRETCSNLDNYS